MGVSNSHKAAVGVSSTHETSICIADVQMATVNVPHVQESVAVAHQNVALPNFQVDDPDVCMISYSNYDPHIITTPGGTVLSVLKPVPYVREEVESYVEPEPNQSNYVYGLCGKRHCSSCKFYDKVKPLPKFKFCSNTVCRFTHWQPW